MVIRLLILLHFSGEQSNEEGLQIMLLQKISDIGWKKLLIYICITIFLLFVLSLIVILGSLLLMDKYDDRYQEPEALGMYRDEVIIYNSDCNLN